MKLYSLKTSFYLILFALSFLVTLYFKDKEMSVEAKQDHEVAKKTDGETSAILSAISSTKDSSLRREADDTDYMEELHFKFKTDQQNETTPSISDQSYIVRNKGLEKINIPTNNIDKVFIEAIDYEGESLAKRESDAILKNELPIPYILPSNIDVIEGQNVTLSAYDSYDPDGTIIQYTWFGIKTRDCKTNPECIVKDLPPGRHSIGLRLTDNNNGISEIGDISINVVACSKKAGCIDQNGNAIDY